MAEKGFCVKCKKPQEMKDAQNVTLKNGRIAVKGKCPTCGTSMFKILGKKK
jgi:RNase P subunit RPR2